MIQCVICEDWYHSRVNSFFIVVQSFPKYHSSILIIYWVPPGFKLWIWEYIGRWSRASISSNHYSQPSVTQGCIFFVLESFVLLEKNWCEYLCHKELVIIVIIGWVWSSGWMYSWIVLLLLTVTDISTTCAVVIFRVKVSCIASVDGIILWL